MEARCVENRDTYQAYHLPSFSSTLLDAIYRSIDDSARDPSLPRFQQDVLLLGEMAVRKTGTRPDEFLARRRSLPPEISTQLSNKRSAAVDDRRRSLGSMKQKSTSGSSSDSSSGGFSSDTDSLCGSKKKKSLKPIRTCVETAPRSLAAQLESFSDDILYLKNQHSAKTHTAKTAKSRAMKLYGELKRMKQPISPGGKLATFLNSLFSPTGNAKKQRISTSKPATGTRSNYTTTSTPTCSTASSYSRSCLSKTPSSAGAKRSVKFCPVSIIVDEDLRPCGQKSLNSNEDSTFASRATSKAAMGGGSALNMEKIKSAEDAAMDLLRNYRRKWEVSEAKEVEMMDDEEDRESCCSSDLFELENLMEIGVDRFCDELPVYETTHVNTNRAIATGLIV